MLMLCKSLEITFLDDQVFESLETTPTAMVSQMVASLEQAYRKTYPWALGSGRQLSSG
jgi:hypothetical protein